MKNKDTEVILKVATKTDPAALAGAIVGNINESSDKQVEMQMVGAGALNQAMKAIATARGFVAPSGRELVCIPSFTSFQADDEERTAIKLLVKEL